MKSILSQGELEAFARSLPAAMGVPGVAVGYCHGDRPPLVAAAGLADVEAEREMQAHTPLRIGSITKTFTATAVLRLCQEGLIGLDDPLAIHLPELTGIQTRNFPLEALTIRRFLTHRAGILSDPPTRVWLEPPLPTIEEVLDQIRLVEVVVEPGSMEKYSNLGYALLGALVARVSGVGYEDFIHRSFLGPAGMGNSGFELPPERPNGYGRRGPGGWRRTPEQELGAERPGGGMWSTAADLLRWASAAQGALPEVVPPALGEAVLAAEIGGDAFSVSAGRSLVWLLSHHEGRTVHWHLGAVEGFTAGLAFVVDDGVAVTVLTNGHAVEQNFQACLELLGIEVAPPAGAAAPEVPSTHPPAEPGGGPVGSYVGPIDFEAQVIREAGELRLGGVHFTAGVTDAALGFAGLRPLEDDLFEISAGRYQGELLRFDRDDRGRVVSFTTSGYCYRRADGPAANCG